MHPFEHVVELAPGDQVDRGLVRITYRSDDQRAAIDTLLQEQTFGVPAQVIQR